MKFDESAWFTSYEITRKTPGETRILVRESIPFPFLKRDEHGYVICLPSLKRIGEETVEYQGMLFDLKNEVHNQIMWNLFRASTCYLSLFTVASDVKAYAESVRGKDEETALNAVNMIEDVMITAHLKALNRSLLPEVMLADAISYLLLKPAHFIRNEGVRFAASTLSCYKTGMIKGNLSDGMLREVKNVVNMLRELEEEAIQAHLDEKENPSSGSSTVCDEARRRVFSELYAMLSKYSSSISEVPAFLYMNHPSRSSIFFSNAEAPPEGDIQRVLEEMMHRLGIGIDYNLNAMKNEAAQALWDWVAKEKKKEKILENYRLAGEKTHFKAFTFPEEDYAEFLRRKVSHSKTIRRITNRLCLYYNLTGDDFRRDTGVIDLQEAIQVVASQSRRIDVFMEDTLRYRAQVWAILVDASLSLRGFAGEVKDIVLCLTEVSRKLFHENRSLGIFAFGDKFYVVKDFSESHTRSVCARIGGIEHSGMTYLPDAIMLTAQALRRQYEETKFLIVVSDGFPSGYRTVAEETKEKIANALRSNVHAIGIGVDSTRIKDYFPTCCVVRSPYELMKSFVDTFFQYSSMM